MHTNFNFNVNVNVNVNVNEHVGPGTRRNKVVTAAEAVRLIHDGDTVVTGGFVGIGFAEEIAVALEARFLTTLRETGAGRATAKRAASIISDTGACRRHNGRHCGGGAHGGGVFVHGQTLDHALL